MVNERASSPGRKTETSFHAQQGASPSEAQAHRATAEKNANRGQLSRTRTKIAIDVATAHSALIMKTDPKGDVLQPGL